MKPAVSVILFTVLSGLGFGLMFWLALMPLWGRSGGVWLWGVGYGLAGVGLVSSTFHLGNPQRALRAFTQWRSSWLSREAWAAVAAMLGFAPLALSALMPLGLPAVYGLLPALLALVTVISTAMIYAQIRAVPRWHDAGVPLLFLAFMLAGGALAAGLSLAPLALVVLAAAMIWHWRRGDGAFARAGESLGTATGLGRIGRASVFEPPHTGGNYLTQEMVYRVGRRHRGALRRLALIGAALVPALLAPLVPLAAEVAPLLGGVVAVVALAVHLAGALAQRWLFFAEAEHVVGLYYGASMADLPNNTAHP